MKQKLIALILIIGLFPFFGFAQEQNNKDLTFDKTKQTTKERPSDADKASQIKYDLETKRLLLEKIGEMQEILKEMRNGYDRILKTEEVVTEKYTEENPLLIPKAAVWMDFCKDNPNKVCIFFKWANGNITNIVFFDRTVFGDRCQNIRLKMELKQDVTRGALLGNIDWIEFKIFCNENAMSEPKKPDSDWFDKNLSQEEKKKWFSYFKLEREFSKFHEPFHWANLDSRLFVPVEKRVTEKNRTIFSPFFNKTTTEYKLSDYLLYFREFGGKKVDFKPDKIVSGYVSTYTDNLAVYNTKSAAEGVVYGINNDELSIKLNSKSPKIIDLIKKLYLVKEPLMTDQEKQKLLDALHKVNVEDQQLDQARPKGFIQKIRNFFK